MLNIGLAMLLRLQNNAMQTITRFIDAFNILCQLMIIDLSQSFCYLSPSVLHIPPQPVIQDFYNALFWRVVETSIQYLFLYSESLTKLVPLLVILFCS